MANTMVFLMCAVDSVSALFRIVIQHKRNQIGCDYRNVAIKTSVCGLSSLFNVGCLVWSRSKKSRILRI